MKIRNAVSVCLGLGIGAMVVSSVALAQQGDRRRGQDQDRTKQPQQAAPSMDEAMQAWMQYAEPGEHHKLLEPTIGTFNAVTKMWMDPTSSDPMVSSGTMKAEWVLGGRFVQQHYKGDFMGAPFEGMGMWGYDRYQKQYTGYWWDTWGTMTHESRGTVNEDGTVFTMHSMYSDPAEGDRLVRTRDVTRIISNDKHIMEMHRQMPDGSWMKAMEITFTRASRS